MRKNQKQKQSPRPQLRADPGWAVDPLSDLVSATELAAWRRDATTAKVMRYLGRFRGQLVEQLAEGASTEATVEATAMRTVEFVSKAQLLKDIVTLAPADISSFYGLDEPAEKPKEKR